MYEKDLLHDVNFGLLPRLRFLIKFEAEKDRTYFCFKSSSQAASISAKIDMISS